MNFAITHALAAFANTRRLARRLRSRADVLRWREARLARFMRKIAPRAPFYAALHARRLEDLPVVDKAALMADFAAFNTRGVTYQQARDALDRGDDRVGGLVVGQSTGTSGNRGMFVISEAERFTWLGVILAKTLPDFPFVRHRVALALPGYSQLYASAAETSRLAIRFFDLGLGIESWRDYLRAFAPDTIVAPPKVLRALAEAGGLAPRHVFSAAEVLDPLDRQVIGAAFGAPVREIYMATEGLFGVGCPHGVLHLAEDVVAFEWAPAAGGSDLLGPIVTDFTRSTQIMARYRMNDLLRLSQAACPCGSPLQAVASIEGRQDDVFQLRGRVGQALVMVTPDVVRNAVVDADRRILDFRVVQIGASRVELSFDGDLPWAACEAASAGLQAALAKAGAAPVAVSFRVGLETPMDRKLRRVRRAWTPPTD
jgi:putative adenylate-forming enzyme